MAATVKRQIALYATGDGKPVDIVRGKIAASQGILVPGSGLYLSTSGTWKACDTSDGSDAWHGFFVGLDDTSAAWKITAELAANTVIKIALIDPHDLYAVYFCTGTAGSDIAAAVTNKGIKYGLDVGAASGYVGHVLLDVTNSNDTVLVVDVLSEVETAKAAAADSPGVGIVKFLDAVVTAEKA